MGCVAMSVTLEIDNLYSNTAVVGDTKEVERIHEFVSALTEIIFLLKIENT